MMIDLTSKQRDEIVRHKETMTNITLAMEKTIIEEIKSKVKELENEPKD
jgi:hypothetical protein